MGRKKTISLNMIKTMEALALKGPSTRWDLAGKCSGRPKDGLTPFSYTLIFKHIKYLSKIGLVKDFGIRKKPRRHPGQSMRGSPPKPAVKHETSLYGLSSVGLSFMFMKDGKVRYHWDTVEENYPETKFSTWLRVARDWIDDPKLKVFPLKTEYAEVTQYGEPSHTMFVKSLLLSKTKNQENVEKGYDGLVELLGRYPRGITTMICYALEREMTKYETLLNRCKMLSEKLKPLRYPSFQKQKK